MHVHNHSRADYSSARDLTRTLNRADSQPLGCQRLVPSFFIQGSPYFPHIRVSVYIFTSWGSVSFNFLILVHFLVLLIYIFLIFKSGLWLLQDLRGQDLLGDMRRSDVCRLASAGD